MPVAPLPLHILLVEDSAAQARFIQQTLREMSSPRPFEVDWADGLEKALGQLAAGAYDLVLLDLVLPDSEGLATFTSLHLAHPEVPVIVLSGAGDEDIALRAVSEGAQDYLAKGSLSPELLTRAIRYALERHRALEELRLVALMDELTGVYNRRGFLFLAEQHLAVARRTGTPVTVLFVDVDGLKNINDSAGHEGGDAVLAEVARLMTATFRESDVIGRIGGDEFCAVLIDEGHGPSTAAERLRRAIDERNAVSSVPYTLSCSIGTVEHRPDATSTISTLLRRADQAMYDEKLATRRLRVLVVDDDARDRMLAETLLSDDFEVVVAVSGRQAIDLALLDPPSLVLLDLSLPDLDGRDVIDALRGHAATRSVPIVIVTADDRDATELALFRAGAEAFVVKPLDDDALRRGVDRALGRASGRRAR
jgi:diguanylate cyclase (GGDEF)-like protein